MDIINQPLNTIYQLNPELNPSQLFEAVNACLCKAEALAITAATTDFETFNPEVINNYLWTLSDIIREARWLYGKAVPETLDKTRTNGASFAS